GEQISPENVAAVLVTASLPPFARQGSAIDVSVASIGDSESLEGGTLILTPLKGADNEVYAVAQGSIRVSGLDVQALGARASIGSPTTGSVPKGARVERELMVDFNGRDALKLALRNPDFTTAARIEDTINASFGSMVANMRDAGTIDLDLKGVQGSTSRFIAEIENLPVDVTVPARIVIDEKSGTIAFGADVTISKVAIAQGNISVSIRERPVASQPNAFSEGQTVVLPRSEIAIGQTGNSNIAVLDAAVTLAQLVEGLNAVGVSPQEMIDIIRAMSAAGAIHAELVIR
ncbi:MAG: flagellar basal body P-ring protein FlgI, partial [Pseudomonadota bacterium]